MLRECAQRSRSLGRLAQQSRLLTTKYSKARAADGPLGPLGPVLPYAAQSASQDDLAPLARRTTSGSRSRATLAPSASPTTRRSSWATSSTSTSPRWARRLTRTTRWAPSSRSRPPRTSTHRLRVRAPPPDRSADPGTHAAAAALAHVPPGLSRAGEITEVNHALTDDPALVNSSAEADGWMTKMKLSKPSELDSLMVRHARAFLRRELRPRAASSALQLCLCSPASLPHRRLGVRSCSTPTACRLATRSCGRTRRLTRRSAPSRRLRAYCARGLSAVRQGPSMVALFSFVLQTLASLPCHDITPLKYKGLNSIEC